MPTFVPRQQSHRAMVRRSDPTRREPGLLDSVLNPVVSNVLDPVASAVVEPVADKVVKPVADKVVKPLVTKVVKPVVDPLLAPLTQGKPQPTPTPPPPTNTPPPTTTPSGGSSGGTGNGGGNNNGNGASGGGGGDGSGDGNGNGNGNGNGSGSGNGSGDGNGNGNGNGNDGGEGESSGGSGQGGHGGSGGGTATGGGPVNNGGSSAGGASTSESPGGNSVQEHTQGATGIGSDQTPTGTTGNAGASPSSGSNFLATGGGVPMNAGSDPNTIDGDTNDPSHTNNPAPGSTALIPSPSEIGTPGTTGNGNSGGGSDGGAVHGNVAASSKGGLSRGAIAGIAIAAVFVVGAVVFLIVRRQRKHKNARRQRWWSSRNGGPGTYNDGVQPVEPRRSVRSSFETTVDHSQAPMRLEVDFGVPSLPPMAQLRRESVLINLDSPVASPQVMVTESPDTPSRFSVGTATSSVASSELGQWLIVNPQIGTDAGQGSPMSVRPFSPTEAFSFPKPPRESSGSNYGSQRGTISDLPSLPVPNPFEEKMQKIPSPIHVGAANPFVDPLPEPNTPSAVHPEFMEVETIKRPFVPTLSDEILVEVGDNVRILRMFDDGWSLVEKNPVAATSAKGKEKSPLVGLIPVDCFRDVGQGVSEFISSKRVSSYSTSHV